MYDSRNSPTGNINDLVQFGGTYAPLPDAFVENKAFQAAPSARGNTLSLRQEKIALLCITVALTLLVVSALVASFAAHP